MVEQLGLAMMRQPRLPRATNAASRFTSGTTSGTWGSMRNAELLSMTTAPASAKSGARSLLSEPPALNSAMSTSGTSAARAWTTWERPPNTISCPALRWLARSTSSETGKSRLSRVLTISRPTAPVAPTTATR